MELGEVLGGRFRVESALRQGGMGRVWVAQDLETNRPVVVKMPYNSWYGPPATVQERHRATILKRFERECDLLQGLEHQGIPRLVARGVRGVEPYLVMEHIDGQALDVFLARNTLTPGASVAVMTQLLDALAYAHGKRVVHRDVKPHNVIVGTDHIVHLIDFGIAYLVDPDATRYTEQGATPGSLGYKAPELIESGEVVTFAADVYGAGCVFFILLTGRRPFEGRSERSVEQQHLYDEPPRVRDFVDHVALAIDDLVDRMLGKDPADRPTAREAIDVLRLYLPRPGDPAPGTLLTPDPTLLFREPGGIDRAPQKTPRRARSRRSPRPGVDRPSRLDYDRLVAQAGKEIDAGEPGPAIARLEETLADVRAAWGLGYRPIARACLRCGDAARLEGVWARARARYRDAEQQIAGDRSAEGTEIALEVRIGLAECLVPEGRLEDAVSAWLAVARDVLALDSVPPRLVARLREVAPDFVERGRAARIQEILDRLPDEIGE